MASLLERKLIVVTGKGGAGKSTIAAALGLLGARRGLRTIVVEVGEQSHLATLYRDADRTRESDEATERDDSPTPIVEIELQPRLWSLSLDPDTAMIEWMHDLGGRLPARVLASSNSFRYFAAAAPGAEELVSLVKLHELSASGRYDLIVLDAPATGHALAMIASPSTFTAIVRGGPLSRRAEAVQEMLTDTSASAYVAVARPTEMAVSETLDLARGLREQLQRELHAVVVNGTITRRFSSAELGQIDALAGRSAATAAVARAARAAGERAHVQRRQLARLRGVRLQGETTPSVASVPLAFTPMLDRAVLAKIAAQLERQLIPSRSSSPSSPRQSRRTRTDRSR